MDGRGRGPRPFRRPLALWRHRRADPAPRRARHPLDHHARGAGLRRGGGGTRRRADPARHRPDRSWSLAPPCAPRPCRKARASTSFAPTGATLCIHLSINNLAAIVRELAPILGADMPVAVVYRATWPDQLILRGTLATIRAKVKAAGITRTALIMVGRVWTRRASARAASTPPITRTSCCARVRCDAAGPARTSQP